MKAFYYEKRRKFKYKEVEEYKIYPTSGWPMEYPECMMYQETYLGSLEGISGYVVYDMYENAF